MSDNTQVTRPFVVEEDVQREDGMTQIGGFSSDGNRVFQVLVKSFETDKHSKNLCLLMNDCMHLFSDSKLPSDMHVDQFIDFGSEVFNNDDKDELYARFMLDHFRRPAITKMAFDEFYKDKKLFASFKGDRYRVTGASRFGDVWITTNFDQEHGYEHRVSVKDLSNWSDQP